MSRALLASCRPVVPKLHLAAAFEFINKIISNYSPKSWPATQWPKGQKKAKTQCNCSAAKMKFYVVPKINTWHK